MAAIKDDQRVTEDTLKSTEELLKIAEQANKIGVDTLVTLNNQGQPCIILNIFIMYDVPQGSRLII